MAKKPPVLVEGSQFIPEVLAPDHLLLLETISRDVENSKLSMALEEQALSNMQLQLNLLYDKIEKQKAVVISKAQKYEKTKQQYISLKKDIFPLYGFKENEGMGYDPVSGKIVRN
jgi:hypothetical protein